MAKKKRIRRTDEYFKREVVEITDGEYVSISPFVKMQEKVSMLHKVCGNVWKITPDNFIRGKRCPHCAGKYSPTTEEFSAMVEEISNGEYVVKDRYLGMNIPTQMMHTICGNVWAVRPYNFVRNGTRCPRCAGKHSPSPKEFIEKVSNLVGDDYSVLGDYENLKTKVLFRHNVCGHVWDADPRVFIHGGSRCPLCAGVFSPNTAEFRELVSKLVGEEYSVESEYIGSLTPIQMRHNSCGRIYKVRPSSFIYADARCPNCIFSRGEKAVADALDSLSIEYIREYSFEHLGRRRFDFFLPDYNIAIEYDGSQHFEAVEHWGGEEALKRTQESDALKNSFCEQSGIDLLRIPYWEFDNIPEIVTDYIESVRHLDSLLQEA